MLARGGKVKRKGIAESVRAGVLFPVSRIHRYLKKRVTTKFRISASAPVFKAAALEYLTAEILELAGNAAKDNRRVRITPRHVFLAIANDHELNVLLKNVTIPAGGTLPRIPTWMPMPPAYFGWVASPAKPAAAAAATPPATTTAVLTTSAATTTNKPAAVLKGAGKKSKKIKRRARFTPKSRLKKKWKSLTASKGSTILSEKKLCNGQKLTVIQGDICNIRADALVHPTNSDLSFAGKIGKTLEKIGGNVFKDDVEKVRRQGKLGDNAVVMCSGRNFSAKNVIHINSPTWSGSDDPIQQLDEAVNNILEFAALKKLKSVAIPSIGSGSAGFPKQTAAETILRTMGSYFKEKSKSSLKQIFFVLYDDESVNVYISELERMQE